MTISEYTSRSEKGNEGRYMPRERRMANNGIWIKDGLVIKVSTVGSEIREGLTLKNGL